MRAVNDALMIAEGMSCYIRILCRLSIKVVISSGRILTIATFLPNWFLISPVLTASGACSWMICESSIYI